MTVTPYNEPTVNKKEQVVKMFDSIAPSYDFFNHFFSFGADIIWRKKAINKLKDHRPNLILDVATGTGDFALQALETLQPKQIIGIDIAKGMLAIAQKKIEKRRLTKQFQVQWADAENLPFETNQFDAVIIAYGVRNFEHLDKSLAELYRVMKPEGKIVILELSQTVKRPIKQLFHIYFNYITPTIGRLFSKDPMAYSYLARSVAAFPCGKEFIDIMSSAGFKHTQCIPMSLGITSIYIGVK